MTTIHGTPSGEVCAMRISRTGMSFGSTCLPPDRMNSSPRYRLSVPSVTMMDGSRNSVTSSPLTRPSAAPQASAVSTPTISGQSGWARNTMPAAMAEKPRIEPIDRSTWRATITVISPIAATSTSGIASSTMRNVGTVRKRGSMLPTTRANSTIMTRMPASRARSRRPIMP